MTSRILRSLLFAAAFGLFAGAAFGADAVSAKALAEKSLLAPDGTLYTVRSGHVSDLNISDSGVLPTDNVIAWSFRRPDGSVGQGLVPDTVGQSLKRNLDLAYDESTGSLVLLFKEDLTVLNILRLGIFRDGGWTMTNLLPNLGFAHAYNPQILLSHQYSQARYAPIFLDEVSDASGVEVYDLPVLLGGSAAAPTANHPAAAYMYPSLQLEGIGGAILASFADLGSDRHYVIRIKYPDNLGKPGPDNVTWQRRRIPVVGVASDEPIPSEVPVFIDGVKTVIGASYRPTIVWNTDRAVGYTRFDGRKWSAAITIPLDDTMTYDRALRLVQEMATRN